METIPNIILHPATATTETEVSTEDVQRSLTTGVLENISNTMANSKMTTAIVNTKESAPDEANKGSGKSFMRRMLSGRNSKANVENEPTTRSKTMSRKTSQSVFSNTAKVSSSNMESTRNSAPRTRQQLSRTQLLPTVSSSASSSMSPKAASIASPVRATAQQSTSTAVGAQAKAEGNVKNVPRKNFVKANMLAAANAKVKSTIHLELPGEGVNTSLTNGKKLGGSSRSLNSDPGTTSSTLSFKRGNQDQMRKSYHASRSTNNNATLSRNSNSRSRNQASQGKPRDRKPQTGFTPSSRTPNSNTRPYSKRLSPRQALEEDHQRSSQGSSRRNSWSDLESEMLKGLKQKQEYFQLVIDNLQANVSQLKLQLEDSEARWKSQLEAEIKKVERKTVLEKQELKDYYLCQLENQRLEIRDEMRKLLSFKEGSSRSSSVSFEPNEGKSNSSSFKDSKEKLFNKIHRLSARMSIQDLDMKELQEVKTWNERKLENELHRLQDSVKKPPPPLDKDKLMWANKHGENPLSMTRVGNCSLSEPDLAGM